jgi:hypothetical protein
MKPQGSSLFHKISPKIQLLELIYPCTDISFYVVCHNHDRSKILSLHLLSISLLCDECLFLSVENTNIIR